VNNINKITTKKNKYNLRLIFIFFIIVLPVAKYI